MSLNKWDSLITSEFGSSLHQITHCCGPKPGKETLQIARCMDVSVRAVRWRGINKNTYSGTLTGNNFATSREESVSCQFWVNLDTRLHDVDGWGDVKSTDIERGGVTHESSFHGLSFRVNDLNRRFKEYG